MSDDQDGCEWVNVAHPGSPGPKGREMVVCVCGVRCRSHCLYSPGVSV